MYRRAPVTGEGTEVDEHHPTGTCAVIVSGTLDDWATQSIHIRRTLAVPNRISVMAYRSAHDCAEDTFAQAALAGNHAFNDWVLASLGTEHATYLRTLAALA